MSIDFPVRMGISSMHIGRAVSTRTAYGGIGHAKKCSPYQHGVPV